ncbi:putative endo-beta-glucanase [Erysiphe neolycopersici]|uniref:Putative endo-beta-glucanase n=1 Tax=Erysiphe neolycopersici TaxID=212602 RepID=A0A420I331_9PEZI|nr:putative endo-beta-glucanase [Erysiphe neolycopersici]
MVLENASNSSSNQGFSDEPPSDTDLYEDSRSSTPKSQYFIDTTNLPKPVPLIGSLLGYPRRFKQEAHLKILLASKELGRPLKQDEVDALAFWLAKRQAITSYGAPIGFAAGCWRAFDTAKTNRFPFWKPSSNQLKVNVFGPLRGPPAVFCWHALRVLAYGLTGDFIGRLLLGSYAMSTSAVGASNDPRLHEYVNSIKEKVKEFSAKDTRARNSVGNASRQPIAPLKNVVDEASPTNNEETFYDELHGGSDQVLGKAGYPIAERWTTAKPDPLPLQSDKTNPLDDLYRASSSGMSEMSNDSGSEDLHISAWERIRSGQHTPLSSTPIKSNRNPRSKIIKKHESSYDSFSYSKSDEERSYAENEAQNQFDARIDRERYGRDST